MRRLDYKWHVLIVIALGTFMVVLDTTIVNIALPRIITIFGSTVDQAQLVLTGYMLALATIMPATPFLSQRLGTKRLYLVTMALFTIGSMLCGLAWSIPSLVVARVLQGLGGGMIQPLGMAMLFRVAPPEQRGTIMGIYALPVMVAPILGPTLGGYLVEYIDWRWVFFLNLPVGILAILMGLLLLRETPIVRGVRFDTVGFVLAALCSGGALLALTDAPEKGWTDPRVVGLLTLALVTLPLFIWWELRLPQPLLNLRLFAIPAFSIGAFVNFVATISLFGAIFLLPVFLQNVRGMGAMGTGLLLFPQALASAVTIVLGGRLYDRVGPRPLLFVGMLALAASTWQLAKLDLTTPDAEIRGLLVVRGAAMGLTMMPAMTAWLASAPLNQTSAASALNNVLRQLFGAFGTAIFATILHNRAIYHQAMLAMFLQPDSAAVMQALGQGQQFLIGHGLNLDQARQVVVGLLASQISLAATVRAFDDCFTIAAIAALLGIIPAMLLGKPAARTAAGAPDQRARHAASLASE